MISENRVRYLSLLISPGVCVSLALALIFLKTAFNFIPFAIHQAFFTDLRSESSFIIAFHILFSTALILPVYHLMKSLLASHHIRS
jgi:hypothetical protein